MKVEGVSFRYAVELLQTDYRPSLVAAPLKRSRVQKLPTALTANTETAQVLQQVV